MSIRTLLEFIFEEKSYLVDSEVYPNGWIGLPDGRTVVPGTWREKDRNMVPENLRAIPTPMIYSADEKPPEKVREPGPSKCPNCGELDNHERGAWICVANLQRSAAAKGDETGLFYALLLDLNQRLPPKQR